MAMDIDIIYAQIHGEVDPYTKKAYFYLYELLRNCILSMTKPTVGGPLEQPPFERPNIAKAVTNFVLYKISHLPWRKWQIVYDMARLFLYCLNFLNFEGFNTRRLTFNADEAPAYKTNYTRWLVFCHVPAFCDSLPHYDIRLIFGKTLLQAVFRSLCRKLMDICNNERDKLATERGVLISTHFPKFLSSLEVEIYSDNSPIWDPEFKQIPPSPLQTPGNQKLNKIFIQA
ncbi:PREDICTED: histone acetyltransferase KAT2A-like [Acromyrmex echinatior]|uniref:histone acetyltransferase KAT2A-like n=1 Tax=Acromyrmex echinatior TaxID=103372 RepID=UPI000581045B|nr:PREDICTED: histone acetyltransferase KAT2A-like [Acromyrmex echinatior]